MSLLASQLLLPKRAVIAKEIVSLAWPIALSMLSYSLMTAVDTLFVGRFGAEAISAVGLGGLVSFTLLTFGMGLLRGGKVIVAHAVGAKRDGEVPRLAAATIVVGLFSTLGTWVLTVAIIPYLGHVFHEPKANELIVSYVVIRSAALPMVLVGAALRELSQGVGDSRGPMWAALTANLANIPLNALLVLGLGWGVKGSAWANVLAQGLDLAILAWLRRDWLLEVRHVQLSLVKEIARKGWPLGAEMFLDVSAFSVVGIVLARLGATEMAAHQIALQISHLSILPILSIGEAASVLAGQAAGAHRHERVPVILRMAILCAVSFSATTGLLLLNFPEQVAAAFTADPAVLRLTRILLYVVVGFQITFPLYCIGKCTLRALGDIRFTATTTVAFAWICSPPLATLFGHWLGWGVVGGWCALSIEVTLAALVYLARLESGAWRRQTSTLSLSGAKEAELASAQQTAAVAAVALVRPNLE